MHLFISYIIHFSILVNGVWLPQEHGGYLVNPKQTCHQGVQFYRQTLGEQEGYRFEDMECVESYYAVDGERYVRPE